MYCNYNYTGNCTKIFGLMQVSFKKLSILQMMMTKNPQKAAVMMTRSFKEQ